MERTFVMVKPDGVMRGLVGEVMSRFERRGFILVGARLEMLSREKVREQYREHLSKPFYPSLEGFITSGPCFLMVWEGRNAIETARRMIGPTNPREAAPGTIRGDLAMETGRNVIHASDSQESATREIRIHFSDEELAEYRGADTPFMYEWSD
ncbi:MAG: nucleoside-diphosphate kinase [Methanomicrobiales archaeon]|nr:nucleoside-diphosphate kinase [Methanomicrobiales archaeon]